MARCRAVIKGKVCGQGQDALDHTHDAFDPAESHKFEPEDAAPAPKDVERMAQSQQARMERDAAKEQGIDVDELRKHHVPIMTLGECVEAEAGARVAGFVQGPIEGKPSCHACGVGRLEPQGIEVAGSVLKGTITHYVCKSCGATTGCEPMAQPGAGGNQQVTSPAEQPLTIMQLAAQQGVKPLVTGHELEIPELTDADMEGFPGFEPAAGQSGAEPRHKVLSALLMDYERGKFGIAELAYQAYEVGEKAAAHVTKGLEARFEAHTKEVGKFLNDLYAIMVDPLAEGSIKVAEMCAALRESALASREFEYKHQGCEAAEARNVELMGELELLKKAHAHELKQTSELAQEWNNKANRLQMRLAEAEKALREAKSAMREPESK